MTKRNTDLFIFVEDPGAAIFIQEFPNALVERGIDAVWMVEGLARDYFHDQKISLEPAGSAVNAGEILSRFQPRLLMVGTSENPDTLGLRLIREASTKGIISIGFVDSPGNAPYRFMGRGTSATAYSPDWILVPDIRTKESFTHLGFKADRIIVCGHPHYDRIIEAAARFTAEDRKTMRKKWFSIEDDRRVILFAGEISGGINPDQYRRSDDYTLAGRGTSTGRTEIVLEEFIDAVRLIQPRPHLVLKPHPKNVTRDYALYADSFNQIIWNGPSLDLAYAADLVVGMATMLLFEAALMGRRTLSILPRMSERFWLPELPGASIPYVTTRRQLRAVLPEILSTPDDLNSGAIPKKLNCLGETISFIDSLLKTADPLTFGIQ